MCLSVSMAPSLSRTLLSPNVKSNSFTQNCISGWVSEGGRDFSGWVSEGGRDFSGWVPEGGGDFSGWVSEGGGDFSGWVSEGGGDFSGWVSEGGGDFSESCMQKNPRLLYGVVNKTIVSFEMYMYMYFTFSDLLLVPV